MNEKVKKEVQKLIEHYDLKCGVEDFADKADWLDISKNQNLSEDFIREFRSKVDLHCILSRLPLPGYFVRELGGCDDWDSISVHQR